MSNESIKSISEAYISMKKGAMVSEKQDHDELSKDLNFEMFHVVKLQRDVSVEIIVGESSPHKGMGGVPALKNFERGRNEVLGGHTLKSGTEMLHGYDGEDGDEVGEMYGYDEDAGYFVIVEEDDINEVLNNSQEVRTL